MNYIYIDILKITAMYFIILLHGISYSVLEMNGVSWGKFLAINSLFRFAVPMFIMCSGAMLLGQHDSSIQGFFKRRFNKVIIPFLAWSILYEVHLMMCGFEKSMGTILKEIYSNSIMYHMWFLYMILIIYLFVPLLRKFVAALELKDYKYLLFVFSAFSLNEIVGLISGAYIPNDLTVLTFLPYAVGYFIIGHFIHARLSLHLSNKMRILGGILFLLSSCSIYYFTIKYSFNSVSEVFWGPNSIFIVLETILLFAFMSSCEPFLSVLLKNSWIEKFLSYAGRLTFGCYLMHVYVLDLLINKLYQGNFYNAAHPVRAAIFLSIVVFIICMCSTAILKKIPILKRIV